MHDARRGKRIKGCANTEIEYMRPQGASKLCCREQGEDERPVSRQAPAQLLHAYSVDGRGTLEGKSTNANVMLMRKAIRDRREATRRRLCILRCVCLAELAALWTERTL